MENPIKMGWFGGTIIFGNTHKNLTFFGICPPWNLRPSPSGDRRWDFWQGAYFWKRWGRWTGENRWHFFIGTLPETNIHRTRNLMLGILFIFLGPPASWLFLTVGLGVIFECNRDADSAFPYLYEERNPGWLKYIGDEIVPGYIGIIVNHYKDPH